MYEIMSQYENVIEIKMNLNIQFFAKNNPSFRNDAFPNCLKELPQMIKHIMQIKKIMNLLVKMEFSLSSMKTDIHFQFIILNSNRQS